MLHKVLSHGHKTELPGLAQALRDYSQHRIVNTG
jgi:hypothetical protein